MEAIDYRSLRGPSCYVIDLLEFEDEKTIMPEYLQIDLIGQILDDFLNQFNLQNLIKDVENFAYGTTFDYKFKDVTYNGTFYDYRKYSNGTVKHQLTIRLSHDGFRYPKV